MNGTNEVISLIDWLFEIQTRLWNTVISQNIFLMMMVTLSLVVMVINLRNNTKQ